MKIFIYLFFALASSAISAAEVKLSVNSVALNKVSVIVSVKNNENKDVCFNIDALGLGGEISDPLFNVVRNGEVLEFLGVREIRYAQQNRSFLILKSKQEISVTHDIAENYSFSLPGTYSVTYDTLSIGRCEGKDGGAELKSNTISFTLR